MLSAQGEIIAITMEDEFEEVIEKSDPTRTTLTKLTINEHFITGSPTRTSS